jgi:hypothetical protein
VPTVLTIWTVALASLGCSDVRNDRCISRCRGGGAGVRLGVWHHCTERA